MNFIDLLFLLLFIGMLALGFFQGMIRIILLLIALYLGVVLASLYYAPLGEVFVRNFGAQRTVAQYLAFVLVLTIGFALLAAAGLYTFRYTRSLGGFEYLNRVGGTLMGMILGALLIGIFGSLLWNLMIVRGGRGIDLPFFRGLGNSVASSSLLPFFVNQLLPVVFARLDPILPDGANLLFLVQ